MLHGNFKHLLNGHGKAFFNVLKTDQVQAPTGAAEPSSQKKSKSKIKIRNEIKSKRKIKSRINSRGNESYS